MSTGDPERSQAHHDGGRHLRLADAIETEKAQRPGAGSHPGLAWWRAAGFGAFIHWGLYALPDPWTDRTAHSEWWTQEWLQGVRRIPCAEYRTLAERFHARHFDADAWVRAFKDAGQRYVVITAKHHDGFCLFDSALTDWTSVAATPFGRDAVAEVAAACAEHGLRFGIYYSQSQDWHHPDGYGNDWDREPATTNFDRYIDGYVRPQIRELLTNYGDIAVVWFDTPMIMRPDQSQGLVDLVHRLQPHCLVNGRVGHGLGDYATTRDNQYLTMPATMDWECPATMNDTWGFREDDHNWKSVDEIVSNLQRVGATGGNYLLNVGPDGEGRIPEASLRILRDIGRRLRVDSTPLDPQG